MKPTCLLARKSDISVADCKKCAACLCQQCSLNFHICDLADETRARQWYAQAAFRGHSAAAFNLFFIHANRGNDDKKDRALAKHWLDEAVKLGEPAAVNVRARKAGLAPPPKAGSNPSSPRPAASAPDLPRIDPYGAVKHVSPDSVVALHVDKPPENVEASPFDLGSVLSDSSFS